MHGCTGSAFDHDANTAYDRHGGGYRNRTCEPFSYDAILAAGRAREQCANVVPSDGLF